MRDTKTELHNHEVEPVSSDRAFAIDVAHKIQRNEANASKG